MIRFLESSDTQKCSNRFEECNDHYDDCTVHPGFMVINCPLTCGTCHLRNPEIRCAASFLNISTSPILKQGEIDAMFTSISDSEHSKVKVLSQEPWIIQFDNFLSNELIDSLLAQVNGNWERSSESGEIDVTGAGSKLTTATRTSSTFWCNNECQHTEVSYNVASLIQKIIKIPTYHFEPIQILKYNVGESFVAHHDYSYQELTLPCGPRVITFFLYLSDVEEGGETFFPVLNISITPKKGRGVVWANTLSRDPSMKDSRMTHEAKTVTRGVKYAANVWVHLLEWERPSLWACTGS
jgi:hypothetical protein